MAEVLARTVLWYLAFFGFAVNYMVRINLNITIVEMVVAKDGPPAVRNIELSNGTAAELNGSSSVAVIANESDSYSLERQILDLADVEYEKEGFHWNEYQQGLVLGSFFWFHWVTQIPGGILAKKYGTKLVFGVSNAIGSWICFLIPMVSYWDYRILIILRILQGLVTGLSWPAMHVLTAKWIPPNERSKFVTAYLGSSVGIAVFYPVFGYVMHWTSWEWVYHICGIIGTIWWFAWLYYVYDTPAQHPRINPAEVRFIEKSHGASVQHSNHGPTPWRAILTSRPVWMNVVAQWGGIWGLFTIMTQAPTYFRVMHNWNIRATGLLSGMPHFSRMAFAYGFSIFADNMLEQEKISRTNLRKLATSICCISKGVIVLGLAFFGENSTVAIILITLATTLHGAVSSGPLASIVDISPNYAGIVLGISGMIGVMPGFISPHIVGILTLGNQTYESWRNVFLIAAAMLIVCGTIYVLFADSTLQPWNSSPIPEDVQKEMQLLHEKPEREWDEKQMLAEQKIERKQQVS